MIGSSHEAYIPKEKVFGKQAERIEKGDYTRLVGEILSEVRQHFDNVEAVEPLADKPSFGDVDLVCLPLTEDIEQAYFAKIFGDRLLDYYKVKGAHTHSLLVRLGEKQVHVDFIQAKDPEDFERKRMFYAKGHLSPMLGMLAVQLNFKYGTEGFFKRYRDQKGNWHDILLTGDLRDGLEMLGYDPAAYDQVHTADEIATFVESSPFFDPSYYVLEHARRKHREGVGRSPQEQYLRSKLAASTHARSVADEDAFLREKFPEIYNRCQIQTQEIERQISLKKSINGDVIMQTFGLKPGPQVKRVLEYIATTYPEAAELSEEMISDVRTKVL